MRLKGDAIALGQYIQKGQDLRILTKLCHSEPSDSEVKNLRDASLHGACPQTK
ncbi:MAG TPA: hypothetical protein V6D14_20315 [Coleofasciculaceae cyanobacterium]